MTASTASALERQRWLDRLRGRKQIAVDPRRFFTSQGKQMLIMKRKLGASVRVECGGKVMTIAIKTIGRDGVELAFDAPREFAIRAAEKVTPGAVPGPEADG